MKSSLLKNTESLGRTQLFESLQNFARQRFPSDSQWARASGVPKETLSRFRSRLTCDSRTLWALAEGAGCTLVALPKAEPPARSFNRDDEAALLKLCASGSVNPDQWRSYSDGFSMGGLATLLAGANGFERSRYLRLAESLHPGITTPEVFALWLKRTPVRPARFLPMLRAHRIHAPA